MHRLLLLFSFIFISTHTWAQVSSDANAKTLLDKVSTTTDSYEAIEIIFEYILENKAENIQESTNGELTLKKEQYSLSFMGFEQMSDGENVWTILTDDEEVQISEIDNEDESSITPTNLLKMYEEGFIYKMGDLQGALQVVELLPEDADAVDFFKINLLIDTKASQIKSLKQFGKNGTQSEYIIKTFSPTIIDDSAFVFDENKFPDFDIVDLR